MQLELPWLTVEGLRLQLELLTAMKLRVSVTDNSSTMMNFKDCGGSVPAELRVHHMFLSGGPEILRALVDWILGRRSRRSSRLLDDFIEAHQHLVRTRRGRLTRLVTQGARHDLQRLYNEVNAVHFDGEVDVPIAWGQMPGAKRRYSIRLGSYTLEDHLIRIHPYLDREFVPEYFVRYIVFHEILHAYVGFETTPSGRRKVHTATFDRLERQYPEYERAIAWHDNPRNLSKLLRAQPRSA